MSRQSTNKFFKGVLFLLGGMAAVVFLTTKSPTLMSKATDGAYAYGDLYRFVKIKRFKPPHPLPAGRSNIDSLDKMDPPPETTPIMFFGDSFGFCDWGAHDYATQLEAAIGKKIFSVYNNTHGEIAYRPVQFLKSLPLASQPKRIFVYERAERSIPGLLGDGFPTMLQTNAPIVKAGTLKRIESCWLINTEPRHNLLLKYSFVTFPIGEAWNSAVFESLRQVPPDVPMYSLEPPFLFYKDEVACFQSHHDEQLINRFADNLALFDRTLRENFNCTLVFVPIPNKITLYSRVATQQAYDDFLPRLCAATKRRGICTVELLPAFQARTNLLYWPTDTHWNNTAIQIAVEETMKAWPKQ